MVAVCGPATSPVHTYGFLVIAAASKQYPLAAVMDCCGCPALITHGCARHVFSSKPICLSMTMTRPFLFQYCHHACRLTHCTLASLSPPCCSQSWPASIIKEKIFADAKEELDGQPLVIFVVRRSSFGSAAASACVDIPTRALPF